jgi:CHAT domain-containing protein/tetratricopeptide (TPR) repeat protein
MNERAGAILEKAYGREHPEVAVTLNNHAIRCRKRGDLALADSLAREALAVSRKVYGEEHPQVARGLSTLANIYCDRDQYAEAEALCDQGLKIRRGALQASHPIIADNLELKSELRRMQGDLREALRSAEEACRIRHRNVVDHMTVLKEKDALGYARSLRRSVDYYLTCFVESWAGPEDAIRVTGDLTLSTKGQVSDGMFERRRMFARGADSTTLRLAEQLKATKFQLANLFVETPGENLEAYRAGVDSLSQLVSDLEEGLLRASERFSDRRSQTDVSTSSVASALPDNTALVEYLKYRHFDLDYKTAVPRYLALVVRPEGDPAIVDLGEAESIDRLVGEHRSHMLRVSASGRMPNVADRHEHITISGALYERLWKPVEGLVAGGEVVFVAPDGALNLIPFGSLVGTDGSYLVERFTFHYLMSGRDCLRFTHEADAGTGLLALGDPDYDADATARVGMRAAQGGGEPTYAFARSIRSGCGEISDIRVDPLPGSREELDLVTAAWKKHSKEPLWAYSGCEASEDALKAEAPGKRVLHLATHGYYLGDRCSREKESTGNPDQTGENPLLLSGLLLAGANSHGQVTDSLGLDDGILTAYEVSAMDLEGVELVVLSACETGLGKIEEGEGVYGLRRAFQMAGARTVISALWPVSDKATVGMMTRLYETRERSIPETMRRVQLDEINDLRGSGQPDHPYTWAGFMAMGDWR